MSGDAKLDAFVKFGELAGEYGRQYGEVDLAAAYPANKFRLDIALSLLKKIKPRRVLDVGCGSGEPLVAMLSQGHKAEGIDFAPEMVAAARETLVRAGHSKDLVWRADMENLEGFEPGAYDCIAALGSLYYARDFDAALGNVVSLLPKGGHLLFSLRNDLFSLFSANAYTMRFLMTGLMPSGEFPEALRRKVFEHLSERLAEDGVERQFKTVDDLNIHSVSHNPLTVEAEVLAPNGLSMEGTYFYHYHAMPPIFEHSDPEIFRTLSAGIENPTDWRGLFMASAFVVHARKQQ